MGRSLSLEARALAEPVAPLRATLLQRDLPRIHFPLLFGAGQGHLEGSMPAIDYFIEPSLPLDRIGRRRHLDEPDHRYDLAMGEILNASGAPDLALQHAERALGAADSPALRAAALGLVATARTALGDAESAHAAAVEALAIVLAKGGAEDVELVVRLAHAESLDALGERAAAVEAVGAAKTALLVRAAAIAHAEQRETFLRRVPANARILQLADTWSKTDA